MATREDLIPNASNQKPVVEPDKVHPGNGRPKYNPDTFPKIAFDVLSSKPMQTKCHLCVALQCSMVAISTWEKKYPDFGDAIRDGLAHGEAKFRDKLAEHAFQPQAKVNNGLIKLLASNVYGIKEDTPTVVVQNNNITNDPEKELKDRGIPIPDIGLDDIDEDLEYIEESEDDLGE